MATSIAARPFSYMFSVCLSAMLFVACTDGKDTAEERGGEDAADGGGEEDGGSDGGGAGGSSDDGGDSATGDGSTGEGSGTDGSGGDGSGGSGSDDGEASSDDGGEAGGEDSSGDAGEDDGGTGDAGSGSGSGGSGSGGSGSGATTISVSAVGLPADLPPTGTSGTLITSTGTASSGTIVDVNLLIDLDHSCTQDLVGVLESPSGTSVTVFDMSAYPVCSSDMENTILDDEAAVVITSGSTPFTGAHQPTSALSAFDGEDAAGVWTLTIEDGVIGDDGVLQSWSLDITIN